jgi:ADP-ribose pyrophosphatase YjhB (NUDIX family)
MVTREPTVSEQAARRADPARARYARRVTGDDVGERVSIRHLVDDPERGPVPTDVVGRLVSHDEDLLLVVDHRRQIHAIDPERVLASRRVPPHPRREPEPTGTRDAPLVRAAARVLLRDADGRVLLVAHRRTPHEHVWTAPGGGIRPGEDAAQAAAREVAEEVGAWVEIGPCVLRRRVTFPYRALWLEQHEQWFLARIDGLDSDQAPLDDAGIDRARWWTLDELETTDTAVAPANLAVLLRRLDADGPPEEPWDLDE